MCDKLHLMLVYNNLHKILSWKTQNLFSKVNDFFGNKDTYTFYALNSWSLA